MSLGELLLTVSIALLVFNPKKWPMVAHHLAKGLRLLQRYKQKSTEFWQTQLAIYQLEEQKKKAEAADKQY